MKKADIKKFEKKLKDTGYAFKPMDQLHGFLTGTICSPEPVMPDNWLPLVFEDPENLPEFKSEQEINRIFGGFFELHNSIIEDIRADDYHPYFGSKEDGKVDVKNWCLGFVLGFSAFSDKWEEAMADEIDEMITSIMFFADPEFAFKDLGIEDQKIMKELLDSETEFIENVRFHVVDIYLYWQSLIGDEGKIPQDPFASQQDVKIGRNDPCPCGSGKKFKKCCGADIEPPDENVN
ncbi:MAG: UPF0149 family protein [candidate division KSB1 bacterium]|jgi:uncharacterized protein|nr:UPF0149 family protein [candidate division KSB1 bacterium]